MAEKKKDRILRLHSEGMSPDEIAHEVDTTVGYVNQVIEKEQLSPEEEEGLGSEMEVLFKIIKEVSRTTKAKSIIRLFSRRSPDDLKSLSELLSRADVPVSDIWLIVQNWAEHRNISPPEDLEDLIEGYRKKGKKKKGKKGGYYSDDDDVTIDINKMRKERLDKLKTDMAIAEMEKELKNMKSGGEEKPTTQTRRRVRHIPKIDKKTGEMKKDKNGNVIMERVEEELPAGETDNSMDPMTMMMMMQQMNQKNDSSSQMMEFMQSMIGTLTQIITANNQNKDSGDTDAKIQTAIKEMENKMERERAQYQQTLQQLQSTLEKKSLEEAYNQKLGQLSDEIDKLRREATQDEGKYELSTKKSMYENTLGTVKSGLDTFSSKLDSLGETLSKDILEERRHRRWLEKQNQGLQHGMSPEEVQQHWESERVPDVSEEEMKKEIEESEGG